jgi:hypothetical protein
MIPEPTSSPSHERDAADHDQPYTWGRPPSTYLAPREIVRLTILRSRLRAWLTEGSRWTVRATAAAGSWQEAADQALGQDHDR